MFPMPADLGVHSLKPQYKDHEPVSSRCDLLKGKPCYYDGSGLNASDAFYALINGGDEGLWKFLDEYYESVFENGQYPIPTEYPKPLRREAQ